MKSLARVFGYLSDFAKLAANAANILKRMSITVFNTIFFISYQSADPVLRVPGQPFENAQINAPL
ncbi:hypothetical protein DENIS_1357 [Desulfonema ishimotonii]|uniref:Uncharacterized protein n=1 Tax=Desulfonema ishimotonii TaxID=45657 RepID=A0A401FTY0_9BACT|nr:hypothetical protein DENIS_1357 [Desulfonema ishimotonii]